MAIKGYFFNAVKQGEGVYDRVYNAEDVTSYLDKIVGNGVFPTPSTQLQVSAGSGMSVTVAAGQGWIDGHKIVNTAALPLEIAASDVLLNRIDLIIFYVDHTLRAMGIEVKQGTAAAQAVAPTLTRTAQRYEMCLAQVSVGKQITAITQSMITDTRANSNVCGFVAGLIQQVDTSTLYDQWTVAYQEAIAENQADFDDWFETVKDTLSTSTLIRKFEYTHITTRAGESTWDIHDFITQYSYALDVLTVSINGLTLRADEYTLDGSTITLATPIVSPNVPITFVIYKSVDGADAETVIEQVENLQSIVGAQEESIYIATRADDNEKLCNNIAQWLDAANDGAQLKITVYGDFTVTDPMTLDESTLAATWFDLSTNAPTNRKVIIDFSNVKQLSIDCTHMPVTYTTTNLFDITGRDVEIQSACVVMNDCKNANVFTATSAPICKDSRFWMYGFVNAGANDSIIGAYAGTFVRCSMRVRASKGTANAFMCNGDVLRLSDCDIAAYTGVSSQHDSAGVYVPSDAGADNVLIMDRCAVKIAALNGYKQDHSVIVDSGFYALTSNMLGKAGEFAQTGDGKTEIGTMIVSK